MSQMSQRGLEGNGKGGRWCGGVTGGGGGVDVLFPHCQFKTSHAGSHRGFEALTGSGQRWGPAVVLSLRVGPRSFSFESAGVPPPLVLPLPISLSL